MKPVTHLSSVEELTRPSRIAMAELQSTIAKIAASIKAGQEAIAQNETGDKHVYPAPYKGEE